MALALMATSCELAVFHSGGGRLLHYVGSFFLGLGIVLYSRRFRFAWPVLLVCPVLWLASELVAWHAGKQSALVFCLLDAVLLVFTIALCFGWVRDRRGHHAS